MISAVVLTKNEENNIVESLECLSWCDEKIVVDDHSTDKTVELAKKKGAKVFSRSMANDFADQRNFALEKAKGDWVFFLDADERVSSALWYEIMQHTSESIDDCNGYYVKRQDTMWGRVLKHGEVGNIVLLRLARKGTGKWEGKVHEKWKIRGKTQLLKNPLDHYPHPTISEFLHEINNYTDIRAEELYKNKIKSTWLSIIVYPKTKFILNYFFKRGFQDGLEGLVLAMMMSLHSYLVRSKLWLLWQKNS